MAIDPPLAAAVLPLTMLLAGAVWHDLRARRIPNRLVFSGAVLALTLQTLLPAGAGLLSRPFGGLGLLAGAEGLGLGLVLLLPMYLLNAMGAGDVKLMAMLGAWFGPQDILGVALISMVAGGVLALAVALWNRSLRQVCSNVRVLVTNSVLRGLAGAGAQLAAPPAPTGKLPYAVAIAAGTLAYLILSRIVHWSILT